MAAIPRFMFSGRVELGHLLQLGGILVLCVSTYYAMSSRVDEAIRVGNEATRRADKLEVAFTTQIDGVKLKIDQNFERVGKQIEAMPLVTDRLAQSEVRARDLVAQVQALLKQISETDRMAFDARETAKRLELRVERLEAPVPLRQTRP